MRIRQSLARHVSGFFVVPVLTRRFKAFGKIHLKGNKTAPVLPDCWVSVAPLHPRVFPGLPPFPLHFCTVSRHWGSVGDGCRCSRAGFVICPVLSLSLGVSIVYGLGIGPAFSLAVEYQYRMSTESIRAHPGLSL